MSTPFDGADYRHSRDWQRLDNQLGRVYAVMSDGHARTLNAIAEATGDPVASVSAQLRHLRKPRFGGHKVHKVYLGLGLYTYRLEVRHD